MILCSLMFSMVLNDIVVDRLIVALGDNEFERREQATQALKDLDIIAYPKVYQAMKNADPEIRRRAEGIIEEIQPRIMTRAATERHVEVKASEGAVGRFGTVISANGTQALILTTTTLVDHCKPNILVEWKGKKYRATIQAQSEDADLTLLSIECERKLSTLQLAKGRTKGVWCDGKFDLNGEFRYEPKCLGSRPGNTGGGSMDEYGAGVFTLDESTGKLMLAGVNIGPFPGHLLVVDLKSGQSRAVPSNCGAGPIQQLLKRAAEKETKARLENK